MSAVEVIWALTLALVVLIVVPLAVSLLHRTFTAAWSIRRYLREMLAAGVGIAGNTGAVKVLTETIGVAGSLVATAGSIKGHSATIAGVLAARAHRDARA